MEQYTVHSLDRAIQLLELLSMHPEGLTLSILSESAGLNKSTAYRLLAALNSHGYVLKDARTNTYYLSLKLYELGCRAIHSQGYLAAIQPILSELACAANEAVHFVLREDNTVVYLCKEDASQGVVQMGSRIGLRNPMYCTGVGKAILAYLPEEEQKRIAKQTEYHVFTPNTCQTPDELLRELALTRRRGYAIDNEEHEDGISCIAVPICNHYGIAYSAISISAPTSRILNGRTEQLAQMLLQTAARVAGMLNGQQ